MVKKYLFTKEIGNQKKIYTIDPHGFTRYYRY